MNVNRNTQPGTRVALFTMRGTLLGFKHVKALAKNFCDGGLIDIGHTVAIIQWDEGSSPVICKEFDVLEIITA